MVSIVCDYSSSANIHTGSSLVGKVCAIGRVDKRVFECIHLIVGCIALRFIYPTYIGFASAYYAAAQLRARLFYGGRDGRPTVINGIYRFAIGIYFPLPYGRGSLFGGLWP